MAAYKRRHPSSGFSAYQRALRLHEEYVDAEIETPQTKRGKPHAEEPHGMTELRKRSYWTFLMATDLKRATAEVLNKHQFNARVTRGVGRWRRRY